MSLRVLGAFICGFGLCWLLEKVAEYLWRNDLTGIVADCARFEWRGLRAGIGRHHAEKHAISAKTGHP